MGILLAVNILLIGLTMSIFVKARMNTGNFGSGAANANRYS